MSSENELHWGNRVPGDRVVRRGGNLRPGSAGLVVLAALSFLAMIGCAVPQPRGQGSLSERVEPTTHRGYYLYLPKDYTTADESGRRARRWPLVMTFHGMKPFDVAYYQACEWQQEADRYGYIVVSPKLHAPDVLEEFPLKTITPAFKEDEVASLAILDQVLSTTPADPSNVMATSWSSGGYMAHYMLNRHPDRFTCLAVRQSNFSAAVLDPALTQKSLFHPIFIFNTQNDFAVCKRESAEAVQWYNSRGYKNVVWVHIKNLGHERTPDMAADFFGRIAGIAPNRAPDVLVNRQAMAGNPEGLAFVAGKMGTMQAAGSPHPSEPVVAFSTSPLPPPVSPPPPVTRPRPTPPANPPQQRAISSKDAGVVRRVPSEPAAPSDQRTPSRAVSSIYDNPPLSIRVSTAIGIEPLALGFSAECPADWERTADFLWTLNGEPVSNGINGHKTLSDAGEHALGLLVITSDGKEYRTARTIRVLPRTIGLTASGSGR